MTAHTPPPRVETPRIVLRPWQSDDAAALIDVVHRHIGHLRPWMPWATLEGHADLAVVAARLGGFGAAFASGLDWPYVMTDRADGTLLGSVGLHARIAPDALEIGYWIRADRSGEGLVTEAVVALAASVFAACAVSRLEIRCDVRNAPSAAVARRAGFRHVTTVPGDTSATGDPRDTMIWELTRPA